MLAAFGVTVGSVLLGGGVGAVTHRQGMVLGALRTFAIAAVVSVVVVQLLPEAVEPLGGPALLAFGGALALPTLVSAALRWTQSRKRIAVDTVGEHLGYLGLVAHQFAEGLALGTYAGPGHGGHSHGNIFLGVAAHTIPLTAVFISRALVARGPRSAIVRTLVLAAATALGFVAADWVAGGMRVEAEPWLSAVVAGFLCHVVLHDHRTAVSRGPFASALDVGAAGLGVGLPLLVAYTSPPHPGDAVREAVGRAFTELVAETAPMLLLGLVLGAALQVIGSRIPGRYFTTGGAARQALRGIAVGAPLPLCACGVLPIAESLRRRGAGPALVMAFLIATPELGPETLTLTVRFLGWPFAVVRLLAALGLAFAAAVVFAALTRRRPATPAESDPSGSMVMGQVPPGRTPWSRSYSYFDELLLHTAPWTFVGLMAAAYVEGVIPADSLAPLTATGLDVLVVGLVAMPSYVCAASATPLAAILLLKGISPGAVLVGLLLGPATNIATIGVLRRGYGTRPVLLGVSVILCLSFALGYAVNLFGIQPTIPAGLNEPHTHGPVALIAVAVLATALLVQLWRSGTAPWIDILHAGAHDHDHVHGGDAHGHGHHHHHSLPGLEPPPRSGGP